MTNTKLKSAEEWQQEYRTVESNSLYCTLTVNNVRAIQANALRYAAELCAIKNQEIFQDGLEADLDDFTPGDAFVAGIEQEKKFLISWIEADANRLESGGKGE